MVTNCVWKTYKISSRLFEYSTYQWVHRLYRTQVCTHTWLWAKKAGKSKAIFFGYFDPFFNRSISSLVDKVLTTGLSYKNCTGKLVAQKNQRFRLLAVLLTQRNILRSSAFCCQFTVIQACKKYIQVPSMVVNK